jgi:ABC-type transport system substrate-binding protein
MHLCKWRFAVGALIATTVGLVATGAAGGTPDKVPAGSMVFGAEQEPPCLNNLTAGCNNTWTAWTAAIALASPLIVNPDFSIGPYMGTGKVVRKTPFTVLIRLNKKARWSDGKPVTADDLIFTWQTNVNPKWDIASRSGWESVARATKVGARAVKFIYKKPYAPWRVQFTTSVLSKHALEGEDFNQVWNTNYNNKQGQTMASGPFKLASYTKGQSIVMVRNPGARSRTRSTVAGKERQTRVRS